MISYLLNEKSKLFYTKLVEKYTAYANKDEVFRLLVVK